MAGWIRLGLTRLGSAVLTWIGTKMGEDGPCRCNECVRNEQDDGEEDEGMMILISIASEVSLCYRPLACECVRVVARNLMC